MLFLNQDGHYSPNAIAVAQDGSHQLQDVFANGIPLRMHMLLGRECFASSRSSHLTTRVSMAWQSSFNVFTDGDL
jgi:hypothetical protein